MAHEKPPNVVAGFRSPSDAPLTENEWKWIEVHVLAWFSGVTGRRESGPIPGIDRRNVASSVRRQVRRFRSLYRS